jgi:hypothetical protein
MKGFLVTQGILQVHINVVWLASSSLGRKAVETFAGNYLISLLAHADHGNQCD